MKDLIDRRDAIDAVCKSECGIGFCGISCPEVNALKALTPAQPNEEFEWCHDCREYDKDAHCCHRWTKAIRKTVEELEATWPKQQWILCSEKLPEEETDVLVTRTFLGCKDVAMDGMLIFHRKHMLKLHSISMVNGLHCLMSTR